MRKLIFGFLILFGLVFQQNVLAQNVYSKNIVKVGISDNNFSKYYFNKIAVSATDVFSITDNISEEVIVEKDKIVDVILTNGKFKLYSDGNEIFSSNEKIIIRPLINKSIDIVSLKRGGKQASYKGNIELVKNDENQFAIVNILPIQTYLKGVVPNEMPVSFGLEALKAQAVLARNYVLKPREKFYKEFDICDSVACQVYFGANTQTAISDKAVDETNNIIVTYKDDLITAVYSSTSGGYTESYKNVFLKNSKKGIMSQNIPYLIGKPDNQNTLDLSQEDKMREFYSTTPETFDNKSPYFRWKYEWTKDELEKILSIRIRTVLKTGFVKTKYPVDLNDKNYFGHLMSININKRGSSGKIVAMTLVTDKNEFTIYKELIIRKIFMINNSKMLPSANVFFDCVEDANGVKIVATGGGFGHGVGMSQYGAGAMAKKGYKYEDIIHHYYTDVKIGFLPVEVKANQPFTQEFYLDTKKIILKTKNKFHFLDLDIIINERELTSEEKKKLLSENELDISNFVKRGNNTITYTIKSDINKNAIFYIETDEKK